MKTLNNLYLGLSVTLIGLTEAIAAGPKGGILIPTGGTPFPTSSVPEMDSSIAALGLGLAIGLTALISEYRRR